MHKKMKMTLQRAKNLEHVKHHYFFFHESEGKMHKKMKKTLQRAKNLVYVKQHYGISYYEKNIFLTLIYIADMAI